MNRFESKYILLLKNRYIYDIIASYTGRKMENGLKKQVSGDAVFRMLKNNETKDGVSILALLYAFAFYR
jgi:hypothetical protein